MAYGFNDDKSKYSLTELGNRVATLEEMVNPLNISNGGTGGTDKVSAKANLGISFGTSAPSGGTNGDIYFQVSA